MRIASKQLHLEPTQEDPRAINDRNPDKGVAAAKKMLQEAGITDLSDENIFITSTCKEKGIQYLKGEGKVSIPFKKPPAGKS